MLEAVNSLAMRSVYCTILNKKLAVAVSVTSTLMGHAMTE
jgi:hypothetical protein